MHHEKIITRPNGDKIRIDVYLQIDMNSLFWRTIISICGKGKRKYNNPVDTDSYSFRRLSMPDREKNITEQQLKIVTAEELLSAKNELWEKLKPQI